MSDEVIRIVGGKPVYGLVELSGDPVLALSLLIEGTFHENNFELTNVPRSKLFLSFLECVKSIGIGINWSNLTNLIVDCNKVTSDITAISNITGFNLAKIFIPLILFRNSEVKTKLDIEIANLYKSLGFIVEKNSSDVMTIKVPNFIPEINKYHVNSNDLFDILSIVYINHIFSDMIKITHNNIDNRVLALQSADFKSKVRVPNNIDEFRLFASICVATYGELNFRNFDLSSILSTLISFEKFGGMYEINKDDLRFWCTKKNIDSFYDLSGIDELGVGYEITLLNKFLSNRHVKMVAKSSILLNDIVTNLNILGSAILIKSNNMQIDYQVLQLKGFKPSHPLKINITNPIIGGIFLSLAISNEGAHKITGLDKYISMNTYIMDNLKSIGCEIYY